MLETLGKYADSYPDPEHPDCVIIRATVGVSQHFSSWLLRYGENVELLEPQSLRNSFTETLSRLSALYDAGKSAE